MKIISIGGGSGSGKSSVSYAMQDSSPNEIEVLNLDDYQKLAADPDVPMIDNIVNWDHPEIINWGMLIADLKKLRAGRSIKVNTWAHRSNSDYPKTRIMISREIQPKPILIVEGYLALFNSELNELYDRKFYFDIDEKTRNARRNKTDTIGENGYEEKVMKPMFKKYIEPTKQKADEVIDVSGKTIEDIKKYLLRII